MYMQALWFIVKLNQVSDGMVVCAGIRGGTPQKNEIFFMSD